MPDSFFSSLSVIDSQKTTLGLFLISHCFWYCDRLEWVPAAFPYYGRTSGGQEKKPPSDKSSHFGVRVARASVIY